MGPLLALALAMVSGCSASESTGAGDESQDDAELVLANLEVDIPVLSNFPSKARSQDNALGERDLEIASWSLDFIRTQDGFEGLIAYGQERDGTNRYFTAIDVETKTVTLFDGVAAARATSAKAADQAGSLAETEFVAASFDPVTVAWLKSELYRMLDSVETELDRQGAGVQTMALSATQMCALRAAIFVGSSVVPFTKVPLVGRGAGLAAQYLGSFLVEAAGDALIGDLTAAAQASTGGVVAATGIKTVLKKAAPIVLHLGASGGGEAAAFVVGAVLGAGGDFQLLSGDVVEQTPDATIIHHIDGTKTVMPKGSMARFLPATCRQAFADHTNP